MGKNSLATIHWGSSTVTHILCIVHCHQTWQCGLYILGICYHCTRHKTRTCRHILHIAFYCHLFPKRKIHPYTECTRHCCILCKSECLSALRSFDTPSQRSRDRIRVSIGGIRILCDRGDLACKVRNLFHMGCTVQMQHPRGIHLNMYYNAEVPANNRCNFQHCMERTRPNSKHDPILCICEQAKLSNRKPRLQSIQKYRNMRIVLSYFNTIKSKCALASSSQHRSTDSSTCISGHIW